MDTSFSVPPPGRPFLPPAARTAPVGDLKRLDGRRVVARILDGLLPLPVAILAGVTQDESLYAPYLLLTLIYFFLTEATGAQTLGKRKSGLRVMRRDGSAPTVNQISIRTVLRLIDDGPIGWLIGAIVWFLAGTAGREEDTYRSAAQAICQATAKSGATPRTTAEWMPHLQLQYDKHAALAPPASLRDVHAQL